MNVLKLCLSLSAVSLFLQGLFSFPYYEFDFVCHRSLQREQTDFQDFQSFQTGPSKKAEKKPNLDAKKKIVPL